jgi:hypothetical protein
MMTVDERLREASQDVHQAAAQLNDRQLPDRPHRRSVLVAVSAAAFVLVLAVPVVLIRGQGANGSLSTIASQEPTATPATTGTADESPDSSSVPDEVRAYWSLEGTLESVGNEPGWLCPAKLNVGYSSIVTASDIPAELSVELAEQAPVESYFRDEGPVCNQPPGVVMLAFADQTGSAATAGMTVYPSLTRFEDTCPPGSCSVEGSPQEGLVDPSPLDDLTINGQPAKLFTYAGSFQLWWVDPNGVPLYALASGLTRDQMLTLAESTTADPATHLVNIGAELPAGLQTVEQEPSVGVWESGLSRTDVYDIEGTDGTSIAISTRYNSGETPYARYAANVEFLELADIDGTIALWISEGGNFLSFKSATGVNVNIEGALTKEDAVQIARDLS